MHHINLGVMGADGTDVQHLNGPSERVPIVPDKRELPQQD